MIHLTACCGVREFDGFASVDGFFYQVVQEKLRAKRDPFAFLTFTDNRVAPANGEAVAKIIRKEELGDLVETEYRKNPNSGRLIRVWVWAPDFKKVAKYYKANCI